MLCKMETTNKTIPCSQPDETENSKDQKSQDCGLKGEPLQTLRRSKRKAYENIESTPPDTSNFYVEVINRFKGRGVFSKKQFAKGERLLEYEGKMLQSEPDGDDTYVFEFSHKNKKYWIDATAEDGTLGRLLNDDNLNPNSKAKVTVEEIPRVFFFAIRDIRIGEEITYSYGPGKINYPWRFKNTKEVDYPGVEHSEFHLTANDDIQNTIESFEQNNEEENEDEPKQQEKESHENTREDDYPGVRLLESHSGGKEDNQNISDQEDEDENKDSPKSQEEEFHERVNDCVDDENPEEIMKKPSEARSMGCMVGPQIDGEEGIDECMDDDESDPELKVLKQKLEEVRKQKEKLRAKRREHTRNQLMREIHELRKLEEIRRTQAAEDSSSYDDDVTSGSLYEPDSATDSDSELEDIEEFDLQKVAEHSRAKSKSVVKPRMSRKSVMFESESEPTPIKKIRRWANDWVDDENPEEIMKKQSDSGLQCAQSGFAESADQFDSSSVVSPSPSTSENQRASCAPTASTSTGRPSRPCKFCGVFQTQLKRHIKRKHKNEKEIEEVLNMPKQFQQSRFNQIKKDGIFIENEKRSKENSSSLIRERQQGKDDVAMCSGCHGVYGRKGIWKHKKSCNGGKSIKLDSIPLSTFTELSNRRIDPQLRTAFLKMRNDDIGNICRNDKVIIAFGMKLWCKSVRRDKKVIMADIRRVGRLLKNFREAANNNEATAADMLVTSNFPFLEDAVKMMTEEEDKTKDGLRISLGYIIKKMIKMLKNMYRVEGKKENSDEMEVALSNFEYNWDILFYRSQVNVENRRDSVLRRPGQLPLEDDIHSLKVYIMDRMNKLMDVYLKWDVHCFTEMRALLVSRLTLFNARRGGEPARMTLEEWNEAKNGAWIDKQIVDEKDPLEKALFDKYSLTYQRGKGSRKSVPLLIPNDTKPGIERLVSERAEMGVSEKNQFLFPYTQKSLDHVVGWACVNEIVNKVTLQKPALITATKFRHRASTLYAMEDIPENERDIFYRHMGHSREMNQNVYQCPLAVREITQVGSYLQKIDSSKGKKAVPSTKDQNSQRNEIASNVLESPTEETEETEETEIGEPSVASSPQNVDGTEPEKGRVKWREVEIKKIKDHFKNWIEGEGYPSKHEVLEFLKANPEIPHSWTLVKRKVMNDKRLYNEKRRKRKMDLV